LHQNKQIQQVNLQVKLYQVGNIFLMVILNINLKYKVLDKILKVSFMEFHLLILFLLGKALELQFLEFTIHHFIKAINLK